MTENVVVQNEQMDSRFNISNYKKAVIAFSVPMILTLLAEATFNIVDALWVSGLGDTAIVAVGVFFPLYTFILALASGLGVGTTTVISQHKGAQDVKGMNNAAIHSLLISSTIAILLTIPLIFFLKPILNIMGAEDSAQAFEYAQIMVAGLIFIILSSTGKSILRGRGRVKAAMAISVLGSVLNMVLDPFLIYKFDFLGITVGLNLGVKGAAIATIFSYVVTLAFMAPILVSKKDNDVIIKISHFSFSKSITSKLLVIGISASLAQILVAGMVGGFTFIASKLNDESSVAVFTIAWRVLLLAVLPAIGLSMGVVPLLGYLFGAKKMDKLRSSFMYALRFGFILEIAISIIIFFGASIISYSFTWAMQDGGQMKNTIADLLRILCFFFPGVVMGYTVSGMFNAVGKGPLALLIMFLRTIVLSIPLACIFVFVLHTGINGIGYGLITTAWISTLVEIVILSRYFRRNRIAAI